MEGFLSQMSAPARRALEGQGIVTLQQLSKRRESDLLALHGMGKASLPKLREALKEKGLSFMTKTNDIDKYIADFPKDTQMFLEQIRATIIKAAPKAEEVISYKMPAYKLHGMLVFFAGYKNHIGFYPGAGGIATFKKEIAGYKNAKGSVQFPLDKALPLKLITRIVKFRVKENLERSKLKANKRK
jgi:uncharacterized protein YdhG (YjbR/CyaY superfamily)